MDIFGYITVVWKETEGYVSKCPELGVASCGDSFEDAPKWGKGKRNGTIFN